MIRKAELNDIFNITKIEQEVLGSTLGVEFLYNEIQNEEISKYFVYTINKELIGYIGFRVYDNNAEMMNFVISENYQNQGYGQQLLDYFIIISKEFRIKHISLEVRKSNKRAIRFYQRNGFVKSHTKKNYYENEDAIFYIKEVE